MDHVIMCTYNGSCALRNEKKSLYHTRKETKVPGDWFKPVTLLTVGLRACECNR